MAKTNRFEQIFTLPVLSKLTRVQRCGMKMIDFHLKKCMFKSSALRLPVHYMKTKLQGLDFKLAITTAVRKKNYYKTDI